MTRDRKEENTVGDRGGISRRRLLKLAAYTVPTMSFLNVANTVRASGHTPSPPPPGRCPNSYGYWKSHPGAWPVDSLTLGDEHYTKVELLAILNMPPRGDASLTLARQLIPAKLNIANGSTPVPVSANIASADSLLSPFAGKLPYGVHSGSAAGQAMVAEAGVLEGYNTCELTPVCDP